MAAPGISTPKISVIVTFFNSADYAKRTINNILKQTFTDYELILVDDGSTDKTISVLNDYAANPIVRIFQKPNGGVSDTRNFGVQQALGEYITFIDGDDIVSPNHLQSMLDAMQGGTAKTMVIAKSAIIPEHQSDTYLDWPQTNRTSECLSLHELAYCILCKRVSTTMWGKLATRSYYLEHPFNPIKRYDESLIAPLIRDITEFRMLENPTYGYVIHPHSMVRSNTSLDVALEYAAAIEEGRSTLLEWFPDLSSAADYWTALYAARYHDVVSRMPSPKHDALSEESRMRKYARTKFWTIASNHHIPKNERARVLLYLTSPRVHDFLLKYYNKLAKGL